MAVIDRVRTTAFRLTDDLLGTVHVYRPGVRFAAAWDRLEQTWRSQGDVSDFRSLPYRGLSVALRVATGDFVALERRVSQERVVVLSRKQIDRDTLSAAFRCWEVTALGLRSGSISELVDDISIEEIAVAAQVRRRPGACPTIPGERWPWDVAVWEVAHRMAKSPLRTDGGDLALRLDSDAALVTWDHLVARNGDAEHYAMHKIVPLLITIPGVEEPVLSFQSSLVRLAPTWRASHGSPNAWADIDPKAPILRARVRHRRNSEGFQATWDDRAADVLRALSLRPLPDPAGEPSATSPLRVGYRVQPGRHPIGRGVGTWFHEHLAHHARATLGEAAEPIVLRTRRRGWPSREVVSPRADLSFGRNLGAAELRVLVIYAGSIVRHRVRDALCEVLADHPHASDAAGLAEFVGQIRAVEDGVAARQGPIEVCFLRPPDADAWLLRRSEPRALSAWLDGWLGGLRGAAAAVAALVETDESASKGDDDLQDPKHVLRSLLGTRGVVTQFISAASAPNPKASRQRSREQDSGDHAATSAVNDLMRSAGFFLRPFPATDVEVGTLVVGIYGARVTGKRSGLGRAVYLVNLVAVGAGERVAMGYVPGRGWRPLSEATAAFLCAEQGMSEDEARALVESAVEQLRLDAGTRSIMLLFDAPGCRRFWKCLQDQSDGRPEPWMARPGTAIVRVRAIAGEVLRPAGNGDWSDRRSPALHTDFRPMDVVAADCNVPTFVVSGSAVMSQGRNARKSSRLAASDRALGEDWHALGTTEILVLDSGGWTRDAVVGQVAMMCRVAPTWDRVLRWPSPLHLARAVVRDHPLRYFQDAEEEESEDSKSMRLDLGVGGVVGAPARHGAA